MNNLKMLTISSLLMISSLFGSNHTIKHKKMVDELNLKIRQMDREITGIKQEKILKMMYTIY